MTHYASIKLRLGIIIIIIVILRKTQHCTSGATCGLITSAGCRIGSEDIQYNLSKSTDQGTDFKWFIYGGGRFRELKYLGSKYFTDQYRGMVAPWSGYLDRVYCVYTYTTSID